MNLSRTWMVRGGAGVALAVISGAWALSIAATGGPSAHGRDDNVAPESSVAPAADPTPEEGEDPLPQDAPSTAPTGAVPALETAAGEATDEATDIVVIDPATGEPVVEPSSRPSKPKPPRDTPTSKPTPQPTPTPTQPSPTPTQPRNECTDLVSGLNCILAPITKRP
jgi:outer membrane biosynthesis protein TonB